MDKFLGKKAHQVISHQGANEGRKGSGANNKAKNAKEENKTDCGEKEKKSRQKIYLNIAFSSG